MSGMLQGVRGKIDPCPPSEVRVRQGQNVRMSPVLLQGLPKDARYQTPRGNTRCGLEPRSGLHRFRQQLGRGGGYGVRKVRGWLQMTYHSVRNHIFILLLRRRDTDQCAMKDAKKNLQQTKKQVSVYPVQTN